GRRPGVHLRSCPRPRVSRPRRDPALRRGFRSSRRPSCDSARAARRTGGARHARWRGSAACARRRRRPGGDVRAHRGGSRRRREPACVRRAGVNYDPAYALDVTEAQVLGPVARDELARLMAHSAVTVCAVRWEEPFGMVAAEAQMAGCPVAGYRRGALPEVVDEGVSGFLAAPDDVQGLATAIGDCLGLDRASVRASAPRPLGLEPALDRYETALGAAMR